MSKTGAVPALVRLLIEAHAIISKQLTSSITSKDVLDVFLNKKNNGIRRNYTLFPGKENRKRILDEHPEYVRSSLSSIVEEPIFAELRIEDYLLPAQKTSPKTAPKTAQKASPNTSAPKAQKPPAAQIYPFKPKELIENSSFLNLLHCDLLGHYNMARTSAPADSRMDKWFAGVLTRSPISLVVCQTNRLLSDSSLHLINPMLTRFQSAIHRLKVRTSPAPNSKIMSSYNLYHLASMQGFNRALGGRDDPLAAEIVAHSKVEVTDARLARLGAKDVRRSLPLPPNLTREDLDYDLKYTSFKLVTVGSNVVNDQNRHAEFFDLIEAMRGDFDIVGARFELSNKWVRSSLAAYQKALQSKNTRHGSPESVELILERAKVRNVGVFEEIMTRFGELGLTRASTGQHALYLLKRAADK